MAAIFKEGDRFKSPMFQRPYGTILGIFASTPIIVYDVVFDGGWETRLAEENMEPLSVLEDMAAQC